MIPLRDENPSRTTPVVTRAIIAANVAVFLWQLILGPDARAWMFEHGLVPARLVLGLRGELGGPAPALLTVLTSMFMHGGWAHLIGNLWYLFIFGDNVEDRLGHVGYAAFYLAAGATAAGAHVLSSLDSPVPTVGASGAIAGVLGAYLVAFPRARVVTLVPLIVVFQVVALPAVLVLGLWLVFQFVLGTLALGMGGAGGGVAWWAHIGGFGFGVVTMAIAQRRSPPSRAWVPD